MFEDLPVRQTTESFHAMPGFQRAQSLESRYTARLLGYILLRFFLSLSKGVSVMLFEVWALDDISDFCGLIAIIQHRNVRFHVRKASENS